MIKSKPTNCISIFEHWLESNKDRFNGHQPMLIRHSRKSAKKIESAVYKFNGVTDHIQLWIRPARGCVVAYNRGRFNLDHIDFDVYPEKTKTGRYFSTLIIPKYRRYFKSIEALFIREGCESLVAWCNYNFTESKYLRMVIWRSGSSCSAILDRNGRAKSRRSKDDRFYKIVPVLEMEKKHGKK